jgi:hypothetical protein
MVSISKIEKEGLPRKNSIDNCSVLACKNWVVQDDQKNEVSQNTDHYPNSDSHSLHDEEHVLRPIGNKVARLQESFAAGSGVDN